MTKLNRLRVGCFTAWVAIIAVLGMCCMGVFRYHYVKTTCHSRLIWSDTRLLLVVHMTETHVRVTPLKWVGLVLQWNLGAAGPHGGHYRQYLIVCEARDGRVETTVCDEPGRIINLEPHGNEVYAEQYAGINEATTPWRWAGGGFERAGEDVTALLQRERTGRESPMEVGWQADDEFDISSFRESRPPLTNLGKDLGATATITKWCEGGRWNSPLRVRFEVSLPNGASKVIDLDMARRSSDAATYDALPASR